MDEASQEKSKVGEISRTQIESFLKIVGERCSPNSKLYLIGGAALELLGGARPTVDLDYVGDDLNQNSFQTLLSEIADELEIAIEAVPLPKDAAQRFIFVDEFGNLEVFIFDPYTIALSKLDRGFESDIEDIVFLVQKNIIDLDQLEHFMETAVKQAAQYDLNPIKMRTYLKTVRQMKNKH